MCVGDTQASSSLSLSQLCYLTRVEVGEANRFGQTFVHKSLHASPSFLNGGPAETVCDQNSLSGQVNYPIQISH